MKIERIEAITAGAVDIVNFDASEAGGITEWRRAAGMCMVHGIELAHHEEPQIAVHMLAAVPNGTYVEAFPIPSATRSGPALSKTERRSATASSRCRRGRALASNSIGSRSKRPPRRLALFRTGNANQCCVLRSKWKPYRLLITLNYLQQELLLLQ